MAKTKVKLQFLQNYLDYPERYMLIFEHAWKVFPDYTTLGDFNFGWDAGLIGENRPYFCECWCADGVTILTYFIVREGIEAYSIKDIEEMLSRERIVWYIGPREHDTSVTIATDSCGNEFYSISIIVSDDCGPYIAGGEIHSFEALNEFNSNRVGKGA